MTDRITLKPRPGLIVRHPLTGAVIPNTGVRVEVDGYWRRRLAAGDVYEATDQTAAKPKRARKTPPQDDNT